MISEQLHKDAIRFKEWHESHVAQAKDCAMFNVTPALQEIAAGHEQAANTIAALLDALSQPAPLAAYAPNDTLPPKGDSVTKIVPEPACLSQPSKIDWQPSLSVTGDTPAPLAGEVADEQREKVMDAIAEALGDAYDCTRVWEAWSVGTMSQDDFSVVRDDQSRLAEIADAAILALRPQAVPMTPEQQQNPFARQCYTMSEPHLSGYRLIVGFASLYDVDAAHTFVTNGITAKAEGGA